MSTRKNSTRNTGGAGGARGAGGAGGVAGNFTMSAAQMQAFLAQLINQIKSVWPSTRNNAVPNYIVPPKFDPAIGAVNPDGRRFQEGTDVKVTGAEWRILNEEILQLTNANIHAVRDQDRDYPWDYANLDADEVDAMFSNLRKQRYPLKAHSQKMVKTFRDFTSKIFQKCEQNR